MIDVDDRHRLGQADWIVGGEAARAARKQGVYAGYVLALFAAIYGFPLVQALFQTTDRSWLRDQLASPVGVAALVASSCTLLAAAVWAGRFRGPVAPPLPWIDLVVTTPIDRALTVRRWWRFALAGAVFVGAVVGLVLGSGLAFAQVTGVLAIAGGTLTGMLLGLAAVRLWLWGQVRSWPGSSRGWAVLWRLPDALRALHAESLRAHSANTSTLAGSALTGNLRTARLAFARPVRRARAARLRPGRPFGVLVRRDLLGLRRQPATLAAGAGLAALGGSVLIWGLTQPAAPPVALGLGMFPLYLGFGAWAEGLRLQSDNIGTPSLIGVAAVPEALAHLVIPAGLATGLLGAAAAVAVATGGTGTAGVAVAAVLTVVLLSGGHLLAAFRGSPPPTSGPQGMVLWYIRPGTIVVLLGATMTYFLRAGQVGGVVVTVLATALVLAWGLARVRRLTHLHRN
ncbi:hypothetical protein OO014_13605 [Intrasporangium calvum]|uniref:Uncharacterized protein n=1 Tax=Intrasporangium calvum TaxID=53358 RepID=A0ABT5GJV5_9MICO|nr:hypothetical protein [Intrasporangium calvum]MDC5698291.1 hypothetical protein [Intrasporangium calvum]